MKPSASARERRGPGGVLMIVAILVAGAAAALWLGLRAAPPIPWRLDIGLLAHNLVPHSPLAPDSHRRASPPAAGGASAGRTDSRSGQAP